LRNDAGVPLLVVIGKCPAIQPRWGYRVAKKDTRKLQPVHNVLQSLLQDGLTVVDTPPHFLQQPCPATPAAGGDNVEVSRAQLP
jgi:hypothetical protein